MDHVRRNILRSTAHVRLVEGEPGVGKTWFGCQLANYELTDVIPHHQKVLFLTFARNAVARIRETFSRQFSESSEIVYKRLRIDTFAGFFWWFVESYGRYIHNGTLKRLWLLGSSRVETYSVPCGYEGIIFSEIEEKALEISKNELFQNLIFKIYPLIIVDEFQDVGERLFEIITNFGQKSRVVLLRGPGQCIYRSIYNFDPLYILEKCRKVLSPYEYILRPVDKQKQRYSREVEKYLNQVKNITVSTSMAFPVKFRSVPLLNRNDYPNQLDVYAAMELRDMKQFLANRDSTFQKYSYAVLASTNAEVARIYLKLSQGSQSYQLFPQSASLLFGDNIFLQYGRLLLRLLSWHRFSTVKEKASEEAIASAVIMLFQEYDNGRSYNLSNWMEYTKALITKVQNMRTLNIDAISNILRARRQDLPDGCPSTPFDRTDLPLLKIMSSKFLEIISQYNYQNHIDVKKAEKYFEKAIQQNIIFEKQGIQKSVQVMTIHKAKGKEFDGVVLVLEDSPKAVWSRSELKECEIEDLYRVAITRAKTAFSLVAFQNSYSKATPPVKKILPPDLFS